MPTLLQVQNLKIYFQTDKGLSPVIKGIRFDISKGETLALVGESGGGKTIASLSIMQLLPPAARVSHESKIMFKDQDLLNFSEYDMQRIRGRHIGMIFQEAMTAFDPVFTIGNQMNEILRRHFTFTSQERRKKIFNLLEEVGLQYPSHVINAYPHQLSGGMRQRAMIAMALAGEPELLIADEPTTALDVTLQKKIILLLKSIQKKRQMSLLFITHDLPVVAQIADTVAVIQDGEIVEQNSAKQFFEHPKSDYSKKLFAAIPSWENRAVQPVTEKKHKPVLKVENLKTYFPIRKGIFKRTVGYVKAVNNINFNLYPNRTLALIGESGSGKTTTGKTIVRLLEPTAGAIYLKNKNIAHLSQTDLRPVRTNLQMVFQDPFSSLDPRMLVNDILDEGMLAQGINKTKRQNRINEILHAVGLDPDMKWRYPHEFSGGQRQRICIARCLTLNPKILICDEPTSSLDVSVQLQILQLLQKLQRQFNLSYLLITHNFSVIAYMADDVAVMYKGEIVEHGDVEKILFSPQHEYTKRLLSAVPQLPSKTNLRKKNEK